MLTLEWLKANGYTLYQDDAEIFDFKGDFAYLPVFVHGEKARICYNHEDIQACFRETGTRRFWFKVAKVRLLRIMKRKAA
jgi:hypothetical protein